MTDNVLDNMVEEHQAKLKCLKYMKDIISEYFKTTLPKRINNYYIRLFLDIANKDDALGDCLNITIMAYNPVNDDKVGVALTEHPNMLFYWNLKHSDDEEVHTEMQVYKNHIIPTLQEMIVKLCTEVVSKPILPIEGDLFEWEI